MKYNAVPHMGQISS